jgi:hypothetical protein
MTRATRFIACLAICLAPSVAAAETRVRSGEHGSFTRLVFYLPAAVDDWTETRVDDGYEITVNPAPVALDTTEVFNFIPRTRISDVALRDGLLWIGSDCDCHLSAFLARPNVLAVDMRDGPDPAGDPEPVPSAARSGPQSLPLPFLPGAEPPGPTPPQSLVAFVPPAAAPIIDPSSLAEAVARAASDGLLRPSGEGVVVEGDGIETRSALDRSGTDRGQPDPSALCQSVAILDDLHMITPEAAWDRIEAGHAAGIDPSTLAMAYLALGFGAEAAAAFTESALPADTAIRLAGLSNFLDDPARPQTRALVALRQCPGVAGLIGLLGAHGQTEISEEQGRAAVGTLSRLPSALRSHIAPHLEKRLAAVGNLDLAKSARFTQQRTADTESAGFKQPAPTGTTIAPRPASTELAVMPETPFFDPRMNGAVLQTIAAGRFSQDDRILVEAWIQEAPTIEEADAATRHYVSALNRAGRPLDALAHLDARIGRRGALRPPIEAALSETLGAATSQLGPGALLLLDAHLATRPWFDRLSTDTRRGFANRVMTVRQSYLGNGNGNAAEPAVTPSRFEPVATGTEGAASEAPPESASMTPRRSATSAAITVAADSIARSERLRAEAIDRAAPWLPASR